MSLVGVDDCEILGYEGISYQANGGKTIDGLVVLPYSAGIPSKIITSEGVFVRLDTSFAFLREDEKIITISGENKKTIFNYGHLGDSDYLTSNYSLDGGKTWNLFSRGAVVAFCNYSGEIHFEHVTHDVIFYNVNLSGAEPFILDKANINLTIFGTNSSEADDDNNAGIQVSEKSTLTFSHESNGRIEVKGDGDGAGIGGDEGQDFGTINIYGGIVRAISGSGGGAAGIGSGYEAEGPGGSITIGGNASVYAKSEGANYYGGAGIGGGNDSGAGTIVICDNADIRAYGGPEGAGIGSAGDKGPDDCNITIDGDVTIYAEGDYGAGIGGGYKKNGGNITINSGTVEAKSSNGGAGIGGGNKADSGNITINGGHIKANVTGGGAKIGHGDGGATTCSVPTLKEITVVTSTSRAAYENCLVYAPVDNFNWKSIRFFDSDYNKLYLYLPEDTQMPEYFTVDGYVFKWNGSSYEECIGMSPNAKTVILDGVDKSLQFNYDGYTLNCQMTEGFSFDCHDRMIFKNFSSDNSVAFSGIGKAEITLDNITLEPQERGKRAFGISNGAHIWINLEGDNVMSADYGGVGVDENSFVRISGDGSLHALSKSDGAAIGGRTSYGTGSIVITSGTVYAESRSLGSAGIGGSYGNASIDGIIINGGHVTAIGCEGAAGIGGGFIGTSKNKIIINGGTVLAYGGNRKDEFFGAGIGSGGIPSASGDYDVVINGGNVYAKSGGGEAQDIGNGYPDRIGTDTFIVDADGNVLVKHTLVFASLPDKTPVDSVATDSGYFTEDVVTLGNKLYVYLPKDAIEETSVTILGTDYNYVSNEEDKADGIHIYASLGTSQILYALGTSVTVLIGEEDVKPDGKAVVLYAVYDGDRVSDLIFLDCPAYKSESVRINLPENFVTGSGDVIFLLNDISTISPLCEKYIVE